MNRSPPKRAVSGKETKVRWSRPEFQPIHDGPYVFRVKSRRSSSNIRDDQDEPPKRSTSIPSARDPPNCNWKNFMKRKSRYGKCSHRHGLFDPIHFDQGQQSTHHMPCAVSPPMNKLWKLVLPLSTTVDITGVQNVDTNARSTHWQCMYHSSIDIHSVPRILSFFLLANETSGSERRPSDRYSSRTSITRTSGELFP